MKVTNDELKQVLLAIGLNEALVTAIDPGGLLSDQGIDSVDYPAFALATEKRYGVKFTDTEALSLRTLADFTRFISAKEG